MSKLAGKDGQHGRSDAVAMPVKPATTERALVNMYAAEDTLDCGYDELSVQIVDSRSRVSVKICKLVML